MKLWSFLLVICIFGANGVEAYESTFGEKRFATGIDFIRLGDSNARNSLGTGMRLGFGYAFPLRDGWDIGVGIDHLSFSDNYSLTSTSIGANIRGFYEGGNKRPYINAGLSLENADSEGRAYSGFGLGLYTTSTNEDNTSIYLSFGLGTEIYLTDKLQANLGASISFGNGNASTFLNGSFRIWLSGKVYIRPNGTYGFDGRNIFLGANLGYIR
jgi:hypothetical protein